MSADGVTVPGVWQIDGSGVVARVAVAEKTPVAVDVDDLTSLCLQTPSPKSSQQQGQTQNAFHCGFHKKRYCIGQRADSST